MTLRTLFALPIAVILLVTLSLAAMIAGQTWSGMQRGKASVAGVERMQILLLLDGNLAAERIATNIALAAPVPLPEPQARRLADARRETDLRIDALIASIDSETTTDAGRPAPDMVRMIVKLGSARAIIDALLTQDRDTRTLESLKAMVVALLGPTRALEGPLEAALLRVAVADPGLSGLLSLARLATYLRDEVTRVAWTVMPRFSLGEQMTADEMTEVQRRLTVASVLTQSMTRTMELARPTDRMRRAMEELKRADEGGELLKLGDVMRVGPLPSGEDAGILQPQRVLIPWGDNISVLRAAILEAIVGRVTLEQEAREDRLQLVLMAFAAILVAVLVSVFLLSRRVVRPLAQLGAAITRIAGGDRTSRLTLRSGATREITTMVTAVETLRRAALVADDAALRHRLAARHRLEMLHEAWGIARTVHAPGQALERGVLRLSEGIDATIALVSTGNARPPETLGFAADAVRAGLADMRVSTAAFEATFAAVDSGRAEEPTEAEFIARILAVQAQVDRRDEVVRAFIKPSLVALRDASSASAAQAMPVLRDLVSDQFQCVEATVAMLASMRDAVTRAMAIVRGLRLESGKIAA